jgi:hypothetical protein
MIDEVAPFSCAGGIVHSRLCRWLRRAGIFYDLIMIIYEDCSDVIKEGTAGAAHRYNKKG